MRRVMYRLSMLLSKSRVHKRHFRHLVRRNVLSADVRSSPRVKRSSSREHLVTIWMESLRLVSADSLARPVSVAAGFGRVTVSFGTGGVFAAPLSATESGVRVVTTGLDTGGVAGGGAVGGAVAPLSLGRPPLASSEPDLE